jgi:hypothetical protein
VSAEKLGVTGGDGVNVNHEAHEVVGRPGFLRESRLNRLEFDVVTTRNPCPQMYQ